MVICDSCGTENPPGTRFCVNPHCQAYLAWTRLDSSPPPGHPLPAAPSDPGGQAASAAVKPGSLRPGGNRSGHPDRAGAETPPHGGAVTLTAAPTLPPRLIEPSAPRPPVEAPLPQTARRPPRYEFIRETSSPISVKPVDEPASEPPHGQAATSGKHGLWFGVDQQVLAVQPGRQVSVEARVANKGTVVEGVDIRVLGVPEDWVRVVPARVNLDVGGQATLIISFAPPRAITTRSGPAEVEVAVWSVSSPKVRCAEHLRLDVGTYNELEVEDAPHELAVRRKAEFELGLRNNGNDQMNVEAHPEPGSTAHGRVLLKFEPRRMALPPGGRVPLTIQARTARYLLKGPPLTHAVQFELLGGGEAKPVEVRMTQQPLLPGWAPKVLALLAFLVAITAGLGGWTWYKDRPKSVPSVINQPVDLAIANLSKAGFKGVPLNIANATVAQGRCSARIRLPAPTAIRGPSSPSPSRPGLRP